jgi:hypothetical protein
VTGSVGYSTICRRSAPCRTNSAARKALAQAQRIAATETCEYIRLQSSQGDKTTHANIAPIVLKRYILVLMTFLSIFELKVSSLLSGT